MSAANGFSRNDRLPLPDRGGSDTIGSISNTGGGGRSFGSSLGGSVVASFASQHSDTWPNEELLTCCVCSGRLVDPLLLVCAHSCCRRCAAGSNSADASAIRCPRCDRLTEERHVKPNAFLACCVAANAGFEDFVGPSGEAPLCDTCSLLLDAASAAALAVERSAAAAAPSTATYWCANCRKFLCDGCSRWHDKFNAHHEVMSPSAAGTAEATATELQAQWPLCTEHGRPLDLLCIDCSVLRCKGGCCQTCIDQRHRLCPAGGRRGSEEITRLLKSLDDELQSLACWEAAVRRHERQPVVLVTSRGLDLKRLQANKKLALDAIAEAHYAASIEAMTKRETSFGVAAVSPAARMTTGSEGDSGNSTVGNRSLSGGSEAAVVLELVRLRVRHTAAYVERLLREGDALDVLDQLQIVEARMLALEEQACQLVSVTAPPPPPAKQSDQLMSQLVDTLSRWIGIPNKSEQRQDDASVQVPSPGNAGDQLSNNEMSHQLPPTSLPSAHSASPSAHSALPQTPTAAPASGVPAGSHPPPVTTKKEGTELSKQQQPLADNSCDDESVPPKVLVFGDAVDSFRVPYDCRDVAVTCDGRVLLAALRHGLKHYTTDGRKLPTWRPSRGSAITSGLVGIVSTVDALDDGRVMVGVIDFQCIFVLRPQRRPVGIGVSNGGKEVGVGGPLIELDRVDLHLPPYRLATCCDSLSRSLLAVVGASNKERSKSGGGMVLGSTWSPGPHLCVYSLGTASTEVGTTAYEQLQQRQILLDLQLDYNVLSVAVTSRAVVTVSNDRVSASAGSGGSSAFVVEARACSFDKSDNVGDLLWRRAVYEDMYDLCCEPQPSGRSRVLYAALPRSVRITALNADDGRTLSDAVVTRSRHAIVGPLRASIASNLNGGAGFVDASWQPAARLVLLAAGSTVIVYPATGRNG